MIALFDKALHSGDVFSLVHGWKTKGEDVATKYSLEQIQNFQRDITERIQYLRVALKTAIDHDGTKGVLIWNECARKAITAMQFVGIERISNPTTILGNCILRYESFQTSWNSDKEAQSFS